MVERLKQAIEKARLDRERAGVAAPAQRSRAGSGVEANAENAWETLPLTTLDARRLRRERIVSANAAPTMAAAAAAFDLLRTRLMKVCAARGWRRIGVTSPTAQCGKSVVCLNLAFSMARTAAARVMVLDMDLRRPSVAGHLGIAGERRLASMLGGDIPPEAHLERVAERLAVGVNTVRETRTAERLQGETLREVLGVIETRYAPTVTLFDLPPMLASDDALAFFDNLDAVLLIAAAGQTSTTQIDDCLKLMTDPPAFLGVVLNKARDEPFDEYGYGYAEEV